MEGLDEEDNFLGFTVVTALGQLASTHPQQYLGAFHEMLFERVMDMVKPTNMPVDRRLATFMIDDVLEHGGQAAAPYYETTMPALLQGVLDGDASVRARYPSRPAGSAQGDACSVPTHTHAPDPPSSGLRRWPGRAEWRRRVCALRRPGCAAHCGRRTAALCADGGAGERHRQRHHGAGQDRAAPQPARRHCVRGPAREGISAGGPWHPTLSSSHASPSLHRPLVGSILSYLPLRVDTTEGETVMNDIAASIEGRNQTFVGASGEHLPQVRRCPHSPPHPPPLPPTPTRRCRAPR